MTVGEWIEQADVAVPDVFRDRLHADGTVSLEALLTASEAEFVLYEEKGPHHRTAAFALLAADAYLTYACRWAMLGRGGGESLRRVARRIARGWSAKGKE